MAENLQRYALIGTGHRAQMYIDAITGPHADIAQLVAVSDSNPSRMDYYVSAMVAEGHPPPVMYPADSIEELIANERVDRVIVTTPDYTHAEMVSRALLAGADVVVEKPLTINAAGIEQIGDAIRRSGKTVATTFNYRYSPRNSALKQLILDGGVGTVTSVTFEWVLDTVHGADYFRRWHRDKASSGGLLVHKASHHFDLVNWWIDGVPRRVFASGGLRFYGSESAAAAAVTADRPRPSRGTGAAAEIGATDPFSLDLTQDPRLKALYLDAEHHDGYRRDRDVFDAGITIEDNVAVIVDYVPNGGAGAAAGSGGAAPITLSYSLNAHGPWEGYRVSVNGTEGRAELEVVERGAVLVGDDGRVVLDPSAVSAGELSDAVRPAGERLILQRHWSTAQEVPIPVGSGGHGGGDDRMLADLFQRREASDDPLGRPAGYNDGVRAVSVGIAANESLETEVPVRVWSAEGSSLVV